MALVDNLKELLAPVIKGSGFLLEEIKVIPVGRSRIISVIIDHLERNITLDEVATTSKQIASILESYSQLGESPFTLEVTTPGVDRALSAPHHWKKNIGRLIAIKKIDGGSITGRLKASNADSALLNSSQGEENLAFSDIKIAKVEIEFNRKEVK